MAAIIYLAASVLALNTLSAHSYADDMDMGVRDGSMLKVLREMVNQTKADTLNLPANATSIRQNITDTFSCENRTYGYYADVDNDCQLFHVCLPSQNPSGRNVTYKWSFICPNETMFNQAVMTCARPRESIDCEDSPMFYDLNMDIGKVDETATNEQQSQSDQTPPKIIVVKSQKRKPSRKKNNLVVENIREIVNGELLKQNLETTFKEGEQQEFQPVVQEVIVDGETNVDKSKLSGIKSDINEKKAEKIKKKLNNKEIQKINDKIEDMNLKRKGRQLHRGAFRFKADVYRLK